MHESNIDLNPFEEHLGLRPVGLQCSNYRAVHYSKLLIKFTT